MNILLLSIILTVIKLSFKATQNLIEQLSLDLLSFLKKKNQIRISTTLVIRKWHLFYILQKPIHNVHFQLKSQSKCRFITVLDWKWNLDTCEDTTQQGILRWGMLLTTWLLSDPCPMIQSTQSSFITLDNFYPPSLTLYIPY